MNATEACDVLAKSAFDPSRSHHVPNYYEMMQAGFKRGFMEAIHWLATPVEFDIEAARVQAIKDISVWTSPPYYKEILDNHFKGMVDRRVELMRWQFEQMRAQIGILRSEVKRLEYYEANHRAGEALDEELE